MADRSGLRLVGFIFASVTFAVMLTTTMVVKGYSDLKKGSTSTCPAKSSPR